MRVEGAGRAGVMARGEEGLGRAGRVTCSTLCEGSTFTKLQEALRVCGQEHRCPLPPVAGCGTEQSVGLTNILHPKTKAGGPFVGSDFTLGQRVTGI